MAWVQLLSIQHLEKSGVSRTYYPGDWVNIGDQSARRMIADGLARFATPQKLDGLLGGCGVALMGGSASSEALHSFAPTLAIGTVDKPALAYARTLFWDTGFPVRPEIVAVGFGLLDTWEVVAPLVSYDELAIHIGSSEARARTEAVIHDLRVPCYEPRFVFVRRCRNGEAFVNAWNAEQETGDDARLCLLRALYTVKPLLCAVPVTWRKDAAAIA